MSIYPKRKKIIKAASGVNTEQIDDDSQPIGGDLRSGVRKGVSAIPVWGQLAEANMQIADNIRGDGSSQGKNVAAGFADPGSVLLEGINKGNAKEVIPVYGFFEQAKRLKREAAKRKNNQMHSRVNAMNEESNSKFGQLTYNKGGEIPDMLDGSNGVQDFAVVLDGKTHEDGGNDVIDASNGEKVAETEREELLFTQKQTEKIEEHIAKYDRTKDQECLLELGTLIKHIVENETVDYSGKY